MSKFLNFTRGGQVNLHGIHMFWQVLIRFFRISTWIFLFAGILIWTSKMKHSEFYFLSRYCVASFCQGNLFCPKTLAFKEPNGRLHQYTPSQMLSIPAVHQAAKVALDSACGS